MDTVETILLVVILLCFIGVIICGIYANIENHRTGRIDHFYSVPADEPRHRNRGSSAPKPTWKDEYNAGHKAGREDALYNDSNRYYHPKGKQSEAYKAGVMAGHDEEVMNWE